VFLIHQKSLKNALTEVSAYAIVRTSFYKHKQKAKNTLTIKLTSEKRSWRKVDTDTGTSKFELLM
jgi:hypothetical protein